MRRKPFSEVVVILATTPARAIHTASKKTFETVLEKGRRFEAVVGLRDDGDRTFFHDTHDGVTYSCPRGVVFVLSGRFRKGAGLGPIA